MLVTQQVVDQAGVLAHGLRALAVRDAGRLDYPRVAAQIVHQPHEALVVYLELGVEYPLRLVDDAVV